MFFGDYRSHAVPFFISSSLLPLDLLYFKSVAVLMYDVSNNTSPPQISNLFSYQHNIHSHNTRSSTRGNFFLEYSRLDKQNMSFSRNGVRVWNNLSNEIRQMPKVKLNATFTICFFRNSRRRMSILICWIWICLENQTQFILIAFYLHYPSSFSCNLPFSSPENLCFSKMLLIIVSIQYSPYINVLYDDN